jgi:hypothetical protein
MSESICREIANGSKHMRKTKIDPKVRGAVVANSGGGAGVEGDRGSIAESVGKRAGDMPEEHRRDDIVKLQVKLIDKASHRCEPCLGLRRGRPEKST